MNNTLDFDNFNVDGKKILLVTTIWNKELLKPLLDEISSHASSANVEVITEYCPGSLELAATLKKKMLDISFDGVIAVGLVIKGDTPHFKLVSRQAYSDLAKVALENQTIPLINGVLTVDNKVQAEERINPTKMNKGKEFIQSLFQMISSR